MYNIGSRNPLSLLLLAGFLCVAALAGKFWIDSQAKVIAERITSAEVLSVDPKVMKGRGRTGIETVTNYAVAKLRLNDGKEFRTTVFQPYPTPGAVLDVKVVEYSDGARSASLLR